MNPLTGTAGESAGSAASGGPEANTPTSSRLAGKTAGAAALHPLAIVAVADSRPDRYLIRNATLTIEARDVREAERKLLAAVRAARGYVAGTHETKDELGRWSITMEVRVPFDRFDLTVQEIDALGKVLEKQVTAEDVTEEFVDSQARLRNLKRTELRLLEHLNRTGRLADVVLVERELNRVRGEIEQLEGRLRFLAHRVAFSSLSITLNEAPRPEQMVPAQTYNSGQQASEAARSLVAFARVLWTSVIWIGIWAIVWAPAALALWLAFRRRRRAVAHS